MSLLIQQLEKSKQNKELLSFTVYGDDSKFWCGYVVDYSEDFVAIQHFTKFGKKDGIIVHPIDNFERIDFNDDYVKAMECVIDYSDQIYKPNTMNLGFSQSENFYRSVLIQLTGNKDVIASFEISNDDYYSGYIIEVSDIDFAINCVGKSGEDLGMSLFKIEDITSIQLDDVDNRRRNILFKWRKASL
ncbi:hypothetical protein [Flavobacterium chungnamense]|uniref:Phage protein n=1 Tax=Flavobacterium chungnamense TaxID=706182 RepID=A0ABP7V026_9FLAO